jgi:hypothetical protein
MGNFLERMTFNLPSGKYKIESVVMDRQSGKGGTQQAAFTVAPGGAGVGISSLVPMRAYTANVKGLDADDPFQYQGGSITPSLDLSVKRAPDAALRLFFTVYQDRSIAAKPTVEIEFRQAGKSLTKIPMELPAADLQGRIPYPMTVPAASIPPGTYEVHAVAKQGSTTAETVTTVTIEP